MGTIVQNIKRTWNFILLLLSYYFSKFLKTPILLGSKPFAMSIEPTTACNLGCPECPSGLKSFTRPTGNIDLKKLDEWASQVKNHVWWVNVYFQGEPFIHKQFIEMTRLLKKHGLFVNTSSNMHFVTEKNAEAIVLSGLDRIVISIDGATQETYEAYRKNGKLEKVIQGTRALVNAKKKLKRKKPALIFQFLVTSANEHEMEDIKKLAKDLGVDRLNFKTLQVYDFENGHPLLPKNLKYSRYKPGPDGRWVLKNPLHNECWRMWTSCMVTWDGRVVPCCFDKDAKYQLGQLTGNTFAEIWNGEKYRQFRNQILRNRKSIDICRNCSEGSQVWG